MTSGKRHMARLVLWGAVVLAIPAGAFAQGGNLWGGPVAEAPASAPPTYLDASGPSVPWGGAAAEAEPSKYAPADLDRRLSGATVYTPPANSVYAVPAAPPPSAVPLPATGLPLPRPYAGQPYIPPLATPYGFAGSPFAYGLPAYGGYGVPAYDYGAALPYGYGGIPSGYGGYFPGGGFAPFTSFPFGF